MPEKIQVKVVVLGNEEKSVELDEGATVRAALDAAEIDVDGAKSIRLGGKTVSLDQPLQDDEIVTVVPKIAGGIYR